MCQITIPSGRTSNLRNLFIGAEIGEDRLLRVIYQGCYGKIKTFWGLRVTQFRVLQGAHIEESSVVHARHERVS